MPIPGILYIDQFVYMIVSLGNAKKKNGFKTLPKILRTPPNMRTPPEVKYKMQEK